METNNRTVTGVRINFLAMIAWLSAIGGEWIPFLVAGAILFLEKDQWLKKQMIKVLSLASITRIFNYVLFAHFLNKIFPYGSSLATVWLEICVFLGEDVLWIILAIRAWRMAPSYSSLDHFAGTCLSDGDMALSAAESGRVVPGNDEAVTQKVCPSCGNAISDDMDFCVNCGRKIR